MDSRPALTRSQSRQIDEIALNKYSIPGVLLMENAGRGCAEIIARQLPDSVLVCCGPGNNGGDGYVIARHLDQLGVPVEVATFCQVDRIQGDAKINFDILSKTEIAIERIDTENCQGTFQPMLERADWVVDAMLGTGVTSAPREPIATAIRMINESQKHVAAIDIPSGLDCDSGQPLEPTIRAKLTTTFVTPKTGFASEAAQEYLGTLYIIDIGIPRALLQETFAIAETG